MLDKSSTILVSHLLSSPIILTYLGTDCSSCSSDCDSQENVVDVHDDDQVNYSNSGEESESEAPKVSLRSQAHTQAISEAALVDRKSRIEILIPLKNYRLRGTVIRKLKHTNDWFIRFDDLTGTFVF